MSFGMQFEKRGSGLLREAFWSEWRVLLNLFSLHLGSSRSSSNMVYSPIILTFFHDFGMFLIIFDHVNACASMCLLVKIHNGQV